MFQYPYYNCVIYIIYPVLFIFSFLKYSKLFPLKHGGREWALYAPPSLTFCLLLKVSGGKPYLKILDLANLFVVDAPMKKK